MVMNERKKQIKVCKRQQYDGGYWVSFHGMQNNQKQYYSPEQVLEIMNKWSLD